jgi:hypothetical protein
MYYTFNYQRCTNSVIWRCIQFLLQPLGLEVGMPFLIGPRSPLNEYTVRELKFVNIRLGMS